jgi:hypothetical protein
MAEIYAWLSGKITGKVVPELFFVSERDKNPKSFIKGRNRFIR